jgi:predicted transcriptional regulator
MNGDTLTLRQQIQNEVSAPDILSVFETVFGNDVRFRIIVVLSNREGAGLREIARNVGLSHKNLAKYLDTLTKKGIVENYQISIRNKVYKLAPKYHYLRFFF